MVENKYTNSLSQHDLAFLFDDLNFKNESGESVPVSSKQYLIRD